ncbi:AAA family ATPase [Candidatus Daviesbacteria bacterium]|nr:AAA family ATPase [Candidatus Daviesbacteria bacterium]
MEGTAQDLTINFKQQITSSNIPNEIKEKLLNLLKFSGSQTGGWAEFEKTASYIEFTLALPFGKVSNDILDLNRAKQILDRDHYGLQSVKDRVLEYLSVLILHKQKGVGSSFHAPILAFIGLVGTGKTTIAYSIAESLGRPIFRIPFGGLGDPATLRGQSRIKVDAEAGQIMKAIKLAQVNNPVILLDEIDRVSEEGKLDIMGVLIELLDPQQNHAFIDRYLDFSYDLSQVMFIATANNTGNISTAVLDRIEPIQMPSYSDEEKMVIGKKHLFPKALSEAGVDSSKINLDESIWPMLIRPLGYDAGIRSLSRNLQGLARKVARKIVEGNTGPFNINSQNLGEYLES